jgi:hypothetical protein
MCTDRAFLREYDKMARQCAAEGVDHVRYLLRLAELEMIDGNSAWPSGAFGRPVSPA